MKLKKQKIGYWVSTILLDTGIILLAQSGWQSRGCWLHPLLELGVLFLLPGIIIGVVTQRCPFCGKFLGILFFGGKKEGTKPERPDFQGLSDLVLLSHNNL